MKIENFAKAFNISVRSMQKLLKELEAENVISRELVYKENDYMKKTVVLLFLVIILVFGLVGCGTQPTGPDGNDTQQSGPFEDDSQEETDNDSSEDESDDDGFWTGVHLPG